MIQAAALGFLLITIVERFPGAVFELSTYTNIRTWIVLLQALLVMQFIVLIWMEYWNGTIMLQWILGLSDYWIPFVFGLVQYFMILSIGEPIHIFYIMTMGFAGVAWWALKNQLHQSGRPEYSQENGEMLLALGSHHRVLMRLAAAYPLVWLAFALAAYLAARTHFATYLPHFAIGSLILSNGFAFSHSLIRQRAFNSVQQHPDFPVQAHKTSNRLQPR